MLGELFVLGTTLPLAWRRTRPIEATLVASAFWLVPLDGYPVLGFVVVILQFFALGSHGEPRRAVALATACACVDRPWSGRCSARRPPSPRSAASSSSWRRCSPAGWSATAAPERRAGPARRRAPRGARRAEEAAVDAERARIAQELHDVVGHEVTLIAIQAEAAAAALRSHPTRAAEPVEAIRATAHRTLAEIRAVLDVLAPTTTDAERGPRRASPHAPGTPASPNTLTVDGHAAARRGARRARRQPRSSASA